VEWLGHRDDIPEIWRQSHIAVLPSYYREGIPRSLLEAAACGRVVVTTDMPGCREVVEDGVSGYLVPPRNVEALTVTLEKLVRDPVLRQRMGREGRELVERDLTETHVVEQTMAVYSELVSQA
jgi:glycosyltransferase involved in cell wall biosynthesis